MPRVHARENPSENHIIENLFHSIFLFKLNLPECC